MLYIGDGCFAWLRRPCPTMCPAITPAGGYVALGQSDPRELTSIDDLEPHPHHHDEDFGGAEGRPHADAEIVHAPPSAAPSLPRSLHASLSTARDFSREPAPYRIIIRPPSLPEAALHPAVRHGVPVRPVAAVLLEVGGADADADASEPITP